MTIFLHKQAEQLSDVKNYVIKAGKEMIEHTFAVCAYGESPYLEKSIRSVVKQSVKSRVIVCTSTPNSYIENLTKKYHLPYYVRQGESSLQDDWNYAYDKAGTEYVTLTHQDDIYHKDYLKYMTVYLERYSDTLIAMTDYRIINQDQQVRWDVSLMVKQMLKLPLRIPFLADKRWVKLGIQAFGNGICCPSVCYHRTLLGNSIFQSGYHYALDWEISDEGCNIDEVESYGMNVYVNSATTLEEQYQEIRDIGKIFGVEETAEAFVEDQKTRIAAVQEKVKDQKPVKVLVYDSGNDGVFTCSGTNFESLLVGFAGGDNIFKDLNEKQWITVSYEEVLARDPDVILIHDYDSPSVEEKIQEIKSNPTLSQLDCVKNERFATITLESVLAGDRMAYAVESMASEFYPELFTE